MQTKIWITGASGRIGKILLQQLDRTENKILATDTDVDVADLESVKSYCDMNRPDVVINCAGLTDTDYCEQHPEEAFRINAIGARNLAYAAQRVRAKIIQLSTDDVFAGNHGEPLSEFDVPAPNNNYGRTKNAGENFVGELNPKHLIIRSSWIYDLNEKEFLGKVFASAKTGTPIEVPMDQFSSPTSGDALANFVMNMINSSEYGLFHASCEGSCSRYEFAERALLAAGLPTDCLVRSFGKRPRYTILDNLMMKITGVYQMPQWENDLAAYFQTHKPEFTLEGGNLT